MVYGKESDKKEVKWYGNSKLLWGKSNSLAIVRIVGIEESYREYTVRFQRRILLTMC